jgi:dGTPase
MIAEDSLVRNCGMNEDQESEYLAKLRASIEFAVEAGLSGDDFWRAMSGAEPREVDRLLTELRVVIPGPGGVPAKQAAARRNAAELPTVLPAPDPLRSQWWFTLDTVEAFSATVRALAGEGAVAFLGAPTVGHYYAVRYETSTTILDADPDVIDSVASAIGAERQDGWTATRYDVANDPPTDSLARHVGVVLDPPWYPSLIRLFFSRACALATPGGFIACVVPPVLTRPGIEEERDELISELMNYDLNVAALEQQAVSYEVPAFELAAYLDLESFSGRSWRGGDLLIVRVGHQPQPLPADPVDAQSVEIFARDRRRLRFFLDETKANSEQVGWATAIPGFDRSVSTRAFDVRTVAAWGSNRRAVSIRDAAVAKAILEAWRLETQDGELIDSLNRMGLDERDALTAIRQFSESLELSAEDPGGTFRRTTAEMMEFQQMLLSEVATAPSERQHAYLDDGFRLAFQRDRDRILWSASFRRLANKTQVFPVDEDDQLRRRLTHSVEVMQLASTIARAFGLDPDLTEAGALAHDLGHTPFGHAGEYALNSILNEIVPKIGGFNHYEHGADVVRWLEDAYVSLGVGGFPGLNLTRDTVECILKHTYFRHGTPFSQTEVLARSKHTDIVDSSGSLEAQAVRIADKLSYLISDVEDGVRLGAIAAVDLFGCRLFGRAPIDLRLTPGESVLQRLISQRRALLKVLMEDVLVSTNLQLSRMKTLERVREADDYCVRLSAPIQADVDQVWRELQEGRLHRDGRVVRSNLIAARTVTHLFVLFSLRPELIENRFRRLHENLGDSEYLAFYRRAVGRESVRFPVDLVRADSVDRLIGADLTLDGGDYLVPVEHVVMAKDYVASLTDTRATEAISELSI